MGWGPVLGQRGQEIAQLGAPRADPLPAPAAEKGRDVDETGNSDNLIPAMAKAISATKAARAFSDLLARVRYRGEEFVIEKGGEPMCRVVPVGARNVRSTAAEFAQALARFPHPDRAYLDVVEKLARTQPKVPGSRWGR